LNLDGCMFLLTCRIAFLAYLRWYMSKE
jgi:hypothetical protein